MRSMAELAHVCFISGAAAAMPGLLGKGEREGMIPLTAAKLVGKGAFDGDKPKKWGKLLNGNTRLARELRQAFEAIVRRLGKATGVTEGAGELLRVRARIHIAAQAGQRSREALVAEEKDNAAAKNTNGEPVPKARAITRSNSNGSGNSRKKRQLRKFLPCDPGMLWLPAPAEALCQRRNAADASRPQW